MNYKLTISWLYPDLMSTYGDRGNVICLLKRCQWRGIEAEIIPISLNLNNEKLGSSDLIFMGGAQDRQQSIAGEDFIVKKGPVLKNLIEKGVPGLFVCAAYQAIGNYYKPYTGDDIAGLGIFDLYTKHPGDQAKRLIGNAAAELNSKFKIPNTIVGFENHGGRTHLGKGVKPFARVIRGFGNNGEDGYEGAVYKNCIGSYFHGPILPKNPRLTDWLISRALVIKYRKNVELTSLSDEMEWQAHEFMLKRLGIKSLQ
ncbi:cobalamin biosynthesis protein CobQ [Candidatus Gottesmanbacteria bacterium RIFCSPHIGHO2_02_FULL_40_13]|uniref:Lipid II isoglutaminyl synthase (glutamine-hydrolyzing) subunit GatD n=1 Tax=Candidatus Gottesmanbacteria bacterium RIFCSPHIGHO2_02_FULL_40_13 TaxID=1798384 RepID=A0A1F6AAB4_9BACT|nr:MAG: cobalamin biosynthesis protein CobQ [Candidatus Gottesmanbacteria bacterium RIFCSPHIGHO2_02_FULL_40_13]